jgi:hypothetical protein
MADLLTSFTTDASGTLRDGIRCVDTENDVDQTDVGWVMEEALLLNLHPVMHYVLNRRNGL